MIVSFFLTIASAAASTFSKQPFATAASIAPPLSTVHVPKQCMGEIAVKRLAEIINSISASHVKIEISTEIVKRKSC